MHNKVHDNKMKKIETKELFSAKIKSAQQNDEEKKNKRNSNKEIYGNMSGERIEQTRTR